MTSEQTDWLVREVVDLLDAGSVGLYEFVWLLRGEYPSLSAADAQACAREALTTLLARQSARLVWLVWPDEDLVAGPGVDTSAAEAWSEPNERGPYLALARS